MQLLKTTIVPADEELIVEMSFGDPGGDQDNSPYLAFRVPVPIGPEGSPPLAQLQRVALQRVRDEVVEQIPNFGPCLSA